MSAEQDFADLMPDTVFISACTGVNNFGENQYGVEGTIKCRIEHKRRRILMPDGRESVSTCTIYAPPVPVIGERDKVVLPDGTTLVVIGIERMPDENGQYYQAVTTT